MSIKRHIYIELLDEGTTVYRPVLSTMIGKDVFILGPKEDNEETWAFEPGETVEVEGDEWTKVTYKGKQGYMMTKFLDF